MKENQIQSEKKLMLFKEKIANLSHQQMNNIVAGKAEEANKNSTKNDFTCTWCGHAATTTTIILKA